MDSKNYRYMITILIILIISLITLTTSMLLILANEEGHQFDTLVKGLHWQVWLTVTCMLLTALLIFFARRLEFQKKEIQSLIEQLPNEIEQLKYESIQKGQQLASILDISGEGVWEWDLTDNSSKIDAQCGVLLGISPDKFSFDDYFQSIHKDDAAQVHKAIEALCREDALFDMKYRVHSTDDQIVWIWDRAKVTARDSQGNALKVAGILLDVTEEMLNQNKIESLAYYDHLTGLPNHSLLNDRLNLVAQTNIKNHTFSGLLLLDLDQFKVFNEDHGRQVGDQLLIEVASRIKNTLRDGDMVARVDGDNFIIICDQVGKDLSKASDIVGKFANDLRLIISQQTELQLAEKGTVTSFVTASIGGVLFNSNESCPDTLLKLAEEALYRAKAKGSNEYVLFDPEMQKQQKYITDLSKDLLSAIDNEQFSLYYQPKYNIAQELTGVEALLRWKHPYSGMISPAVFIPLAEESDYIVTVGEWVLSQACKQLEEWQYEAVFSDLQISINISAKHIWHKDFISNFKNIIQSFEFDPAKLTIEVTETILLRDLDDAMNKLLEIKEVGCQISLDDFGTGYSSMSYLKNLPIDEMKIDRAFIDELVENRSDLIMVKSIIDLGRNFNLKVVAEGVETLEQYKELASLGCAYYQGYYFQRPLPKPKFEEYARGKA